MNMGRRAFQLLLLSVAASLTTCREASAQEGEVTYLMFSQQWSAGSCQGEFYNDRCIRQHERNFWTIHGMWPSNNHGSPEFCNHTLPYNETALQPIYSELERYWPSYTSKDSNWFWKHEWLKHGTCATGIPALSGISQYFNTTLNFYFRHNITRYLEDSDIYPTVDRTYAVEDIEQALTDDLRGAVNFVCNEGREYSEPLLAEIRLCLDTELQPTDCQEEHSRCGRHVYYLPFDVDHKEDIWDVHLYFEHKHYVLE
ncbi:ribonuclease DdI-like isoform X1 [Ornithodoros turicata]|uniref:ribonuclease DdI-like isoform X1 n=2 Tax=Ornithodoros turicata TaxID=34597 RepID=UPI003138BF67